MTDMDQISTRLTPEGSQHLCVSEEQTIKFLGALTSSRLKQQHNKQGQLSSAPCKSISSFQRGTNCFPHRAARKAPLSTWPSHNAQEGQVLSSICLCLREFEPSWVEIPCVGCCRNKYRVVTLGITAL